MNPALSSKLQHPLARLPLAILAAAFVTLSAFYLMQLLIATGKSALTEEISGRVLDFVRVKQPERVERAERKPERPPAVEKPPPPPAAPQAETSSQINQALSIGDVNVDVDLSVSSGLDGGTGTDGDMLPIVKVAPVYPPRAMQRGLEGWVLVEFTVSASGTVRDVVAVDADPRGVFEQAAIDAAGKFRYKPRVVGGKAVDVSGVQNVIRFELER